ncbi:hypothetical protein AB4Y83_20950, partial [Terrabacter sp. RAF57]
VAVVAAVVAFARISRRRTSADDPTRSDAGAEAGAEADAGAGAGGTSGTTTDDPLPTDPQQHRPGQPGGSDGPDGPAGQPS